MLLNMIHSIISIPISTDIYGKPFKIIKMPHPEPIYIDITPDDDCYCNWEQARFDYEDKLLDGSDFPTGTMNVLPAMSYCNFLIANGIVLAQKYYKEEISLDVKRKDKEALDILKSVFPDRKVVAIDVLPLNLYGGGIHCHTRNVPCR
jgi:agmatine deiminase